MLQPASFEFLWKGNIASTFIDNKPMVENAELRSGDDAHHAGRMSKDVEDIFLRKCGFPIDGPVGLFKCIAAYLVYATAELEFGNQSFKPVESTPSTLPTELLEMRKLLEAQTKAMAKLKAN